MRRAACLIATIVTLCGAAGARDAGKTETWDAGTMGTRGSLTDATRDLIETMRGRSLRAREALSETRDLAGRLVLEERDLSALMDRYPDGSRAKRGEILAMGALPGSEAVWEAQGLKVVRRETLEPLGIDLVILRSGSGETGRSALRRLRAADPAGSYDLNHLYDPSSAAGGASAALRPSAMACEDCRIGVVDSGADLDHRALRRASIESRAFSGRDPVPSAHGTAVASLLVGRDGAAVGARLFLADVYGGEAEGGSAESIARALAWLASKETPVVSLSLAGPPNGVLETAISAMLARGHIVVAAVGNGGPAAPAAYPAAYPGVIGATAIDGTGHPAFDAQRGPQVSFAAYGVDMQVAEFGGGETILSGTSFAAPRVAARAAALLSRIGPADAATALNMLQSSAIDLGAPGRDEVFGYGALESLRLTAATSP